MSAPDFPTPWQRKTLWTALTTLAVVMIFAIGIGLIWTVSQVLAFLQPILVPFAIAGVLAYLLNPIVTRIVQWGTSRHRAVFAVFAVVTIIFAGMMVWIVPALSAQSINLARTIPRYADQVRERVVTITSYVQTRYGINLVPVASPPKASDGATADFIGPHRPVEKTSPVESATTGTTDVPPPAEGEPVAGEHAYELQPFVSADWLQAALRQLITHVAQVIRSSLGGFLGVIGFLVSLIIVPIYLYYFLIEAPSIEKEWRHYVPLRASGFKDEVVSTLSEINGYLIAFFRGQLVVSIINGAVTGIGLVIAGLEFGLLIGLALCVLGIIPYLGITMCWLIAVIIASMQGGSWCVGSNPWWLFPLVISGIFIVVHNFDALFVTPKIVGESVGLHPLTVIFSVFAWSLLMGGLLGAILSVPMTATLKVLLRRYVWERRFRGVESPIIIPATALQEVAPPRAVEPPEISPESALAR